MLIPYFSVRALPGPPAALLRNPAPRNSIPGPISCTVCPEAAKNESFKRLAEILHHYHLLFHISVVSQVQLHQCDTAARAAPCHGEDTWLCDATASTQYDRCLLSSSNTPSPRPEAESASWRCPCPQGREPAKILLGGVDTHILAPASSLQGDTAGLRLPARGHPS